MGTPPATGWTPPVTTLAAFPSDEITAFESPRAIVTRDPSFAGDPVVSKVLCAARIQTSEVAFEIRQRNASGTPVGAFAFAGDVISFLHIGELNTTLSAGTAIPTSAITVVPTPSSQAQIEGVFDDAATLSDMGVDLVQLIVVNDEFMLVSSASINGGNVDLEDVYRGVLDSAQQNHSSGDSVFLIFVAAGLTDTNFPVTNNVDIELRMRSQSEKFLGAVTPIALTMDKRTIRPYPPASVRYNGTATDYGTPDLEGDGAGENGFGFDVDWLRRAFDTSDEIQAMLTDNTAVDASTEYRARVFVDPAGINTEIASSPTTFATGSGLASIIPRLEILELAAAGTTIRVQLETRHDILAEVDLTSRNNLIHDVIPTSVNTGLFYLGGNIAPAVSSNTFTVATAGVHTVRIGAAYGSADVEIQINGGGFSSIITAGGTSGVTGSLSISDTVEVRTDSSDTPDPQWVEIEDPVAARVAYATFSA